MSENNETVALTRDVHVLAGIEPAEFVYETNFLPQNEVTVSPLRTFIE